MIADTIASRRGPPRRLGCELAGPVTPGVAVLSSWAMPHLLRIDASVRVSGSRSRQLADHFEARWMHDLPERRVTRRDLAVRPPPHLDEATIDAFGGRLGRRDLTSLSEELVAELLGADEVLISTAMYNFGPPSPLKAYLDHVVRSERTFRADEGGYAGLLAGRRAVVIVARGGVAQPDVADDFLTGYLRSILAFVGLGPIETIVVDGTATDGADLERRMTRARGELDCVLAADRIPWLGPFTPEDRDAIAALRLGQAAAIERGDADAYAALCTDDVVLMIPGHALVSGRAAVLEAERRLFQAARFAGFRKTPARIERQGDLAVELGRQEVTSSALGTGVFAARQKYMHVFRRTSAGWRFAALMSNACD